VGLGRDFVGGVGSDYATPVTPWPIETHRVRCEHTGVDHVVWVATPNRYAAVDEPFPLLLVLDAPWMFGTVVDATRIMSMSREAPEAVVAGLGFATDQMSEYLRQRARWLTPTPWVPPTGTGVKGVEADECGRAAEHAAFVIDQLLPFVEDAYRTSERTFVGHSFSALFGLRLLLLEPETFRRYLLASPSIWWDERAVLDLESERARTESDLPARVFLSAGSLEHGDPPFDMAPNIEELAGRLRSRGYPSLVLDHQVMPGDAHSSTIGAAVSRGLRSLFVPA
jgi:predicted alpha/beta superfamily hydrolase